MSTAGTGLEQLQAAWKEMFQKTLPAAATSKSDAQPKWPVHVDHCFARIILDSTVGIETPWMSKIKSPAYKNMTREQLEASIELGEKILRGEADLVELDNRSLEVRGKGKNPSGRVSGKIDSPSTDGAETRKREREQEENNAEAQEKRVKVSPSSEEKGEVEVKSTSETKEDLTRYLKKIALSSKTDFQKKVLTTLCQVPRGKYSTYGAMAKHLNSSPRAVGNALRNNPFAPHVPCHRILASGGGLGGFHGSWGRKGKEGLHDDKKRTFLREEGVRFDGKGMVVGSPWEGFT